MAVIMSGGYVAERLSSEAANIERYDFTFWARTSRRFEVLNSKITWSWRWRYYDSSKRRNLLAQRHGVASRRAWHLHQHRCHNLRSRLTSVDGTEAKYRRSQIWRGSRGLIMLQWMVKQVTDWCGEGREKFVPRYEFLICIGDYVEKQWAGQYNYV